MANNNLKIKNYTDAPEVEITDGLDVVAVNATGTLNRIPIENFAQGGSNTSKPIYLIGANGSGGGGIKGGNTKVVSNETVQSNTILDSLAEMFNLTISDDDEDGDIFAISLDITDEDSYITIGGEDWISHGLDAETVSFIYTEFLKGRPLYYVSQAEGYYILPINEVSSGYLFGYGQGSNEQIVLFGPYNGGGAML